MKKKKHQTKHSPLAESLEEDSARVKNKLQSPEVETLLGENYTMQK